MKEAEPKVNGSKADYFKNSRRECTNVAVVEIILFIFSF